MTIEHFDFDVTATKFPIDELEEFIRSRRAMRAITVRQMRVIGEEVKVRLRCLARERDLDAMFFDNNLWILKLPEVICPDFTETLTHISLYRTRGWNPSRNFLDSRCCGNVKIVCLDMKEVKLMIHNDK